MKKKIVTLSLVVALIAIAVVGGTLAYFTDDDAAENTFTFGKVDIELEETSVADDTKGYIAGEQNTTEGFDFDNILPGLKYAKEPVITVEDDSLDAYVFAELIVGNYNELYAALTAAGVDATKLDALLLEADLGTGEVIDAWQEGDVFHIVYTNGVMEAEDSWTVFKAVQIPAELTSEIVEDLGEVSLKIQAYAVQAEGIADAAAAWAVVDPVQG